MRAKQAFTIPTPEELQTFRLMGDPLADEFVKNLCDKGQMRLLYDLMGALKTDYRSFEENCPKEYKRLIHKFVARSAKLPKWANQELIEEGQLVFKNYSPSIFMLLNLSALPICFACKNGAKVLYETGSLLAQDQLSVAKRRLMDTAQMVIDVFAPYSLQPNGIGIRSMQRVRLIHALTRYHLKTKTDWNDAEIGLPINQEDMAGTNMSFSTVVIAGMQKLDIALSEKEIAGYMHCWKIVGYMMGIDKRFLPDTYEDGRQLAAAILNHQAVKSAEAAELADTHLKFLKILFPFNASKNIFRYLINHFIHEFSIMANRNLSDCIGISSKNKFSKLPIKVTFGLLNQYIFLTQGKITSRILAPLNIIFLQQIIKLLKIDFRSPFIKKQHVNASAN